MSIELIKSIRAKTGLPIKDINKAIEAMGPTDEEKIITHLREQGVLKQQARENRETNQGGIFTYNHDNRLGVILEVKCETDFVSKSDSFKSMGHDLVLHIAAFQPRFVRPEEANEDFIQKELEISKNQLIHEGKPEDKIEMILNGKKQKILQENSLMTQSFIKDANITVADYIAQVGASTGEKIVVSRFTIYSLNS